MSNSSLVSYTKISPNKTSPRNHVIDTVTIHCTAGQCSVETLGSLFAPTSRQASCNYGIGKDGKIGMYVEEKDRSWCSSNSANDNRAITIEVSSDAISPYAVNDKAYASLIELLVDICKRNNIKKLVWSTNKNDRVNHLNGCNMTVHRDYAAKSCPGQYLYERHGQIADEVNKRLGVVTTTSTSSTTNTTTSTTTSATKFTPYLVKVTTDSLNIRKGAGTNYGIAGVIKNGGIYTIVAESTGRGATKWGKLKSGAGWISLDFVKKV